MFIVRSCVTLIEYFIVFPVVLKTIIHYPAQPASASPLIDDTRQNAWSKFPVSPPQLGLAPCHPGPCQHGPAPAGDLEGEGDMATGSSGPPRCGSRGSRGCCSGPCSEQWLYLGWGTSLVQKPLGESRHPEVPGMLQATHRATTRTSLGGSKACGAIPACLESRAPMAIALP